MSADDAEYEALIQRLGAYHWWDPDARGQQSSPENGWALLWAQLALTSLVVTAELSPSTLLVVAPVLVALGVLVTDESQRVLGRARDRAVAWYRWWQIGWMPVAPVEALVDGERVRVQGRVAFLPGEDGFAIRDGGGVVWVSGFEPWTTGIEDAERPEEGALVECVGRVDASGGPRCGGTYRDGPRSMAQLRATKAQPIYLRALEPARLAVDVRVDTSTTDASEVYGTSNLTAAAPIPVPFRRTDDRDPHHSHSPVRPTQLQ